MDYLKDLEMTNKIATEVQKCGGRVYFVGGYVRDKILGAENKDIDIEVHGIDATKLEGILGSLGSVKIMGESFSVYSLRGYGIDISFPRSSEGKEEPFAGTFEAAKRRDLTINSLMQDVLSGEIVDHFDGVGDIKRKIIRHIEPQVFEKDPLRIMRAAGFAARFGFDVADSTVELCKNANISGVAKERVEQEIKKALLKSEKPSLFFETLKKMEQLGYWFPELSALVGITQNPVYHAEGDVWTHTMMVTDCGAGLKDKAQDPFGFMLACVCHDFGKAVCTEEINGVIHAYGHEIKGLTPARTFLERITDNASLIKYVLNLVELHMRPNMAASCGSSVKSTNKMFDKARDPGALICIAEADTHGRISEDSDTDHTGYLTERLAIYNEYMSRPYVTGQDLIDAGFIPGKDFSEILEYAHKLRLAGTEKQSALKQVLSYARKKN